MTQSSHSLKDKLYPIAIVSYVLLIVLLAIWPFLNTAWPTKTQWVVATIHVFPLLLPLLWMLKKQSYAFQLSLFLILLYFIESVLVISQNHANRWLGIIELGLVVIYFFATLFYLKKPGEPSKT